MDSGDDHTLCIIKPDAYAFRDRVITLFLQAEFDLLLTRTVMFSPLSASWFYQEHAGRPYFQGNVDFMCSGPCLCLLLHKHEAITKCRELLGATDPAKAAPGTIRQLYGTGLPTNAAHASDSRASFLREAQFVFSGMSLVEAGLTLV